MLGVAARLRQSDAPSPINPVAVSNSEASSGTDVGEADAVPVKVPVPVPRVPPFVPLTGGVKLLIEREKA